MSTLYTTLLSANGRKVLAVARHLELSPEVKMINVYQGEGRSPSYLAINPSGKIPALVEGDFILSESNAILVYLAEAHGNFDLWSRAPQERAAISQWLFWEASEWQPALTTVLAPIVGQKLGLVPATSPLRSNWNEPGFQRVMTLLDAHLQNKGFLVGDRWTLADFSVAGMLTYARAAEFPFDSFRHVGAWYARVERTDAWRATATAPWA